MCEGYYLKNFIEKMNNKSSARAASGKCEDGTKKLLNGKYDFYLRHGRKFPG